MPRARLIPWRLQRNATAYSRPRWIHNSVVTRQLQRDEFWNSSSASNDLSQSLGDLAIGSRRDAREFKSESAERKEEIRKLHLDRFGVKINARGHLIVVSREKALQPQAAVLVLNSTPTSLRACDFFQLAKEAVEGEENVGGLINAIISRDEHHNRLQRWILQFESPYHAAFYQQRLLWYEQNLKKYGLTQQLLPGGFRAAPPPGFVDPCGEDVWRAIYSYSLTTNIQEISITPMLPPFPKSICDTCEKYETWSHRQESGRCWPVRIFAENTQLCLPTIAQLVRSGQKDGIAWDLVGGSSCIEPLYTDDGTQSDSWILRFRNRDDALRFWKLWHRRQFESVATGTALLLQVDLLW